MSSVVIPAEQLNAIADKWVELYQYEATPYQIVKFRAALISNVAKELSGLPWNPADPSFGSYLRRFICYSENLSHSWALKNALEEAGMKCDGFAFQPDVMSIDPGVVYMGVCSDSGKVWSSKLN